MKLQKPHYILIGLFGILLIIYLFNGKKELSITDDYIPLKVWQTYKSRDLPPEAERCRQTWINQEKTRYHFMSDIDIEKFIRNNFSDAIYYVFISLPLGVMRADLWRYCVLYKHGGIYSDIDSVLLLPISKWTIGKSDKIIIGLENDIHFCQWTIVSSPGHPILKMVIDMVVTEFQNGIDINYEHFVHKHTGPGIWTKAINTTLGFKPDQKAIDTWKCYHNPKFKNKFEKMGIRLESKDLFSREYVKNLFGSTQFKDGYESWITEKKKLLVGN